MLTLHNQVRLFTIGPDSDRCLHLSLTIYLFACCSSLERNVSLVLSDLKVQHFYKHLVNDGVYMDLKQRKKKQLNLPVLFVYS